MHVCLGGHKTYIPTKLGGGGGGVQNRPEIYHLREGVNLAQFAQFNVGENYPDHYNKHFINAACGGKQKFVHEASV